MANNLSFYQIIRSQSLNLNNASSRLTLVQPRLIESGKAKGMYLMSAEQLQAVRTALSSLTSASFANREMLARHQARFAPGVAGSTPVPAPALPVPAVAPATKARVRKPRTRKSKANDAAVVAAAAAATAF